MTGLNQSRARSCQRKTRLNGQCRPGLEALENRQLLSTCHVTRLSDQGIGKGFRGDLRYCITKANTDIGLDTIDFTVTGTIKLESALPEIDDELTVAGPGRDLVTIDAQKKARVFYVEEGVVAAFSGLTVTGGGQDPNGGGFYNEGDLTLSDCAVTGNTIHTTNGLGLGAGIYNEGTLIVSNCSVSGNVYYTLVNQGMGIYNSGTLTVDHSVISDNFAGGGFSTRAEGVGVYNAGTATIRYTTISSNEGNIVSHATFDGYGGGIYNKGELLVDSSLIANNQISGDYWGYGGGLYNITGNATIINTTIYNNLAFANGDGGGSARGGGIYAVSGSVTISHSTIATNRSGGLQVFVDAFGGGIAITPTAKVHLHDSIVAGNDAKDGGHDLYGYLTSSGFNLIGSTGGGGGFVATDLLNVDPMLGPLVDNGGPTQTMSLLPGSPAINTGDNTDAPEFDQRGPGFLRIVNGTVDIGAFEVQATREAGRSGLFYSAINYAVGQRPTSVFAADFTHDAKLDLVVANSYSDTVTVLKGNGKGGFRRVGSYATGDEPSVVVGGDVNQDGQLDLVVSNWSSASVSVLLGDSNQGFLPQQFYAAGDTPGGMAPADFNGDGALDLAVANSGSATVSLLLGDGNGGFIGPFSYPTGLPTKDIRAGDFNGDGKLDLAAVGQQGNAVYILIGRGDGSFKPSIGFLVGSFPTALEVADLNSDGRLDIVTANYSSGDLSVLFGEGNGFFQSSPSYFVGSQPHGVAIADYNADGSLDIVANLHGESSVALLLNNGDGTFQTATKYAIGNGSFDVLSVDLNSDGAPDVVTANGASNNVSVLLHAP